MMTSSPGSTNARMVESIASVTPQQTVISASGSTRICRKWRVLSAIASRITFAPQVVAYWLKSWRIASTAASLSSAGAAKSGNPWARLIQSVPCSAIHSRVISLITDSVKVFDFRETVARDIFHRMPEVSRHPDQVDGVTAFRKQFPIFDEKVYLSSCSQGALARPVEAGVQEFLESWHRYGNPWESWVGRMEELRAEVASLINAQPDEVAGTVSVSSALNSLPRALRCDVRPRVVTSDFDFPTVGHIWLAQQRRGADVVFAQAQGDRLPLTAFEQAVDGRTALLSTTHVCYRNMFKNNVSALADLAHERGALLRIDAYQSIGTQPMDVTALDLDILVTVSLKYLLGSPGVAVMYIRKDLIERFEPSDAGWVDQENVPAYDQY